MCLRDPSSATTTRLPSLRAAMDFRLTAEQQLLADSVREFCAREVIPFARSWDEAEDFPHELVPKLAAMGLWGMRVPEAYGGAGMSMLDAMIVMEEIARADGAVALTVASHNALCS